MKTIALVAVWLLITLNSFGQKWEHIYGYPGTDESFKDLIEFYDKGYLISGSYEQEEGNWLIKTDINGNQLWDKVLKWDNVTVFRSNLAQDKWGNTILASVVSGEPMGYWPMITKLDSCGEKVWCRVFPNFDYEFGWYNDVLVLENQDIVALAFFETSAGNFDQVFLDHIDSGGNLLWRQVYASQDNYPHIRSASGDGIKKYGNNYMIHGHCYYPYPSNLAHVYQRPLFIMLDSLFNEQWIIPFGVSDLIVGKGFHTIAMNDSVFMGVGVRRLGGLNQNSLMMYFNDAGEEISYVQIPNNNFPPGLISNQIHDIAWINDSLLLASMNFGFEDADWPWGEAIIDTAGNIYDYEIRLPNSAGWTTLVKTFDDKYVIGASLHEAKTDWDIYMYKINEELEQDTIYPGNYTYDSLCPYPIKSGIIDISDCMVVTDIGESPDLEEYLRNQQTIGIKAIPNPSNTGEVLLEFENTVMLPASPPLIPPRGGTGPSLIVYNMLGKKVHEERVYRYQGATHIDVSTWPEGMYVAIISSNGEVKGKCKVLVK